MPLLDSLGSMDPKLVQGVMLGFALPSVLKYDQQHAKMGGGAQKGPGGMDPQILAALAQLFGGMGGPTAPQPPAGAQPPGQPMPPRYPAPSSMPGAQPATALPPIASTPRIAPVGAGM